MDEQWKELTIEVGKVVEASGRMLQRKPALTKQDLTDLSESLRDCSEVVQRVRDNIFK